MGVLGMTDQDQTATIKQLVSDICEHKDCARRSTVAYVVTGEFGKDGIAVYCDHHAELYANPSDVHTTYCEVQR